MDVYDDQGSGSGASVGKGDEVVRDKLFGSSGRMAPDPKHYPKHVIIGPPDDTSEVSCTCGWLSRGFLSELFEEYADHRVNVYRGLED